MPGEVPGEFIEAFDFKRQVGEVRLDLDGFATGKITEFNFLFAAGGFEENELRAARRFVPPDLREAEHVAIEFNSAFEIVDAIASVQKFADFAHARKIARSPGFESKIGAAQSRFFGWGTYSAPACACVDKLADVVSIVISLFFRMMCKINPHGR